MAIDDGVRIIGEDGKLMRFVPGTAEQVGGTAPLKEGQIVMISAKAPSGSKFGALAVGQFYYSPVAVAGASTVVGDKWFEVGVLDSGSFVEGPKDMLDLSGWSLEISADEIETTVLADDFKQYRKGKKDANGTASFVYTKGVTDATAGLAGKFFDIVDIDETGVVTVTPVNNDPVYLVGFVDKTTETGYTRTFTIMKVELYNFSLPMNMGEAMTIESPFRLANGSKPVFYKCVNA